ncbi:hypothetical protein REPUB_Repub01dG0141500 [Reevesia pubescens]
MRRFYAKRVGIKSYNGPICPDIQDKLEKLKNESFSCLSLHAGRLKYEVECGPTSHVMHLGEKTCTCRRWDLTGMPCKHDVSAIYTNRERPETYVHPCYSKETYLAVYGDMINPIRREHEWPTTKNPNVAPLIIYRPPSRPRKLRKKASDEPQNPYKMTRKNKPIRCGNCG